MKQIFPQLVSISYIFTWTPSKKYTFIISTSAVRVRPNQFLRKLVIVAQNSFVEMWSREFCPKELTSEDNLRIRFI